ncbi:hypothetical protein CEE37_03945 [candidate division LCP-89 bacterium B3_LCP]|uniref:Secretion system C-terminal sorting domain-containing protein n=1 Tax=candidate division LCP-89 bacterium B3_LCP TaxID=2012998 RepID=A0A532V3K2_UNCL8|nr:MAG: hypothetical protein CEE37_03945 [candidate division LCP-89 bacterium B3_LCP]
MQTLKNIPISTVLIVALCIALLQIPVTAEPLNDYHPEGVWPGEPTDDALNVNVVSFNMNYWPLITLYVQVSDSNGAPVAGLPEEAFELYENDILTFCDVEPADFDGTSYGMALDCSGSMYGYENDVIFACTTFVAGMTMPEQAAVIYFESFGDTHVEQPMTNNHDLLTNAALGYYANGATAQWYGYTLALEEFKFELQPRMLLGFTDGMDNSSGSYTQQTTTDLALLLGAPVYTIGLGGVTPGPLIEIANATGGSYIQTQPDSLWYYYRQIQHAYQNQYKVAYITPDPSYNGSQHTARVIVDYNGDTGEDSTRFAAPFVENFAPAITLTPSTVDPILTYAQPAGNPVTIGAYVTDNDVVTSVMLRFRYIGSNYYNHAYMLNVSDSTYEFTFDGAYVQTPGIDFYILASDSYYHVTSSPETDPSVIPHQIVVLPNDRPEITHIAVATWQEQTPLPVSCDVVDTTANVDQVVLCHKNDSEIYYTETDMVNIGGDTYETVIPAGDLIALLDLEYYLIAYDDQETYRVDGPHHVNVGTVPLVITMTPVNPPIQIPATGGSFDFNIELDNQDTSPMNFDAWIMVTLPNGSPFGPVLGPVNLLIPASTSVERTRTQAVPENAPPGEYIYEGLGGIYPNGIWASDSFTFEKLTDGDGASISQWFCYGEDFDQWLAGNTTVSTPLQYELSNAYPNPFNPSTILGYKLPVASLVKLAVYDISGRLVSELVNGWRDIGVHEVMFEASDLASGLYIYHLDAGDFTASGKMILMK